MKETTNYTAYENLDDYLDSHNVKEPRDIYKQVDKLVKGSGTTVDTLNTSPFIVYKDGAAVLVTGARTIRERVDHIRAYLKTIIDSEKLKEIEKELDFHYATFRIGNYNFDESVNYLEDLHKVATVIKAIQ